MSQFLYNPKPPALYKERRRKTSKSHKLVNYYLTQTRYVPNERNLRVCLQKVSSETILFLIEKELSCLLNSGLAWNNIPSMISMKKSGPISLMEASCGSPKVLSDNLCSFLSVKPVLRTNRLVASR